MRRLIHTVLIAVAFLLAVQQAGAAMIRDDVLRIHANILPKMVLMDYDFRQKLENNSMRITIIHRDADSFSARRAGRYIREKYKNGINNIPVDVKLVSYQRFNREDWPSSLYYFLPASAVEIKKALENLQKHRPVFVYDPEDLGKGAMLSLHIGRRIRPLLNLDALKAAGISLRPALVRISELYCPDAAVSRPCEKSGNQ